MELERIPETPIPEGRELLFDILAWARPHDSQIEKMFCKEYLDPIEGMQQDEAGNRFIRVGDAPVLWSCHVDTVDAKDGIKAVYFNETTGLASLGKQGKPGQCLGADDGAGVWLLLEMLRRNIEGLYVFHRGEERGCIGSSWIAKHNPSFLNGIQMAIAFDRKHYGDVITYQSAGRCCSDTFANALAAQLNLHGTGFTYKADDTGLFTDTNEYTQIVPECTNLSVGYDGAHGPRETLDVRFLEQLLEAVCKVDFASLPIERDPSVTEFKYGGYGGYNYASSWDKKDPLYRLVFSQSQLVADFLEAHNVTVEHIKEFEKAQKEERDAAKKDGAVVHLKPDESASRSSGSAEGVYIDGKFFPYEDEGESVNLSAGDGDPIPVDEALNQFNEEFGFYPDDADDPWWRRWLS